MKNETERERIINSLKEFFNINSMDYHIDLAFLYGSWVDGQPLMNSDVDIALVLNEKIVSEQEIFSIITSVSCDIEKILNREINVLNICRDFRKPMLYYNAIISGIPVFVKDAVMLSNLQLEAISQMEDFSIWGVGWQLENARMTVGV